MNQALVFKEQEIAAYNPFRAQLAELKKGNEQAIFDYADPKGEKEARSHIHKLRKTKGAIEKVRKEQKADALEYGRRVDSQAKEIVGEIEQMIDVHQKPLDEIAEKEAARIEAHKATITEIEAFLFVEPGMGSDEYRCTVDDIASITVDDSLEEFEAEALLAHKKATKHVESLLADAVKREAEQAELEKLRAEAAAREQEEREKHIADEAKAKAEAEAKEAAARREREIQEQQEAAKAEAERKEREAKEALQRAERERQEAVQQAEARAMQAATEERARIEAEQAKAEAEAKKKASRKAHQKKINNEALASIMSHEIMSESVAKALITLIAKGELKHLSINY